MNLQEKYKDEFILLAEAGFIATNQADEDAALKLFHACELLRPDNSLPRIGMGYLHLLKLELNQACELFNGVLTKEPNNEMAKVFLGLSYAMAPTEVAKGEKLLNECASKANDKLVKNLAENALEFVENYIKKSPSPEQLQPQQPKKKKK